MAGLSDITGAGKTVKVAGVAIKVKGLSFEAIAALFARFDKLREQIAAADGLSVVEIATKAGPDACAAIINAATGEDEEIIRKQPFGVQVDLLDAIIDATMPGGNGPLARTLKDVGGFLSSAAPAPVKTPSPTSSSPPPPSSG